VPSVDWVALAPVLLPVLAVVLVLLVDGVLPGGQRIRRALDAVAVAGLLAAAVAVAWLAVDGGDRATVCVGTAGSGDGVARCSYVVSELTLTLQAVIVAGGLGCLVLALASVTTAQRTPHHVLMLSAVAGAAALAGARDLASLVVALETASLPVIGLVALRRDARGAQAGVTMLLTAVASLGLLLLGVALLYAATGELFLEPIAATLAAPGTPSGITAVAGLGTVLGMAGIAFKLSAVPFHLWTPDTYAGAPLPVAAFLAVVSKAAGLAAVVVLLGVGLPGLASTWGVVLAVLAAVTVTFGNLVALRQREAIRLLAWSTVAQAGWVLLPLGSARDIPSVREAVAASVGYLIAYAAATLAVFAVVTLVARNHEAGERHLLTDYRGLARRKPAVAAVLGFGLACLAGLPPGVMGLVAKIVAVRPLVDGEVWVVALVAAVNVALGIAYYLRWGAMLVAPASTAAVPESAVGVAAAGAVAAGGQARAAVVEPELVTVGAGGVPGGVEAPGAASGATSGARSVAGATGGIGPRPVAPAGDGPADDLRAAAASDGPLSVRFSEGLVMGVAAAVCLLLSVAPQVMAGVLPGVLR
jgi:NADH-quinone oxidoreductase subunit N